MKIKINDLPALEDLSEQEQQQVLGGAKLPTQQQKPYRPPQKPLLFTVPKPIAVPQPKVPRK